MEAWTVSEQQVPKRDELSDTMDDLVSVMADIMAADDRYWEYINSERARNV